MRWVSLGSIGLIAFMGCTGPVAAQQTQSRPKQKRGATRALLLASTALATGIFAGAIVNPQTAQATCSFSAPPFTSSFRRFSWENVRTFSTATTVSCDTNTVTTNDMVQLFVPNQNASVSGLISQGVTVGGAGLSFEVGNNLSNSLSVSNAGTVTTAEAVNALSLSGSGGDVLYTGNGSATNTAGMAAGLSISNTGTGIISATVGTRGLPGGPPTLSGSTGCTSSGSPVAACSPWSTPSRSQTASPD